MTDPETPKLPVPTSLSRRLRSMPLAVVLSVALVLAWTAYLVIAPVPTPLPESVAVEERPAIVDPGPVASNQMRILLWRDVLGPDVLSAFEVDSGLNLSVDRYNTFEDLTTIMDGDRLNYDLVIASGMGVPSMIERELLQTLPTDQLPRAEGLDPAVLKRAGVYDATNAHALPIVWGTVGLAFDRIKIAERLGADTDVDSWSLLFDPSSAKALADCGIQVVDAPGGVFSIALAYLNRPHDSATVEDTDSAARLWEGVRSSIGKFSTPDVVDGLARGDVCFAMAASGDAYQAAAKSRTLGAARDIGYAIPTEGAVLWHAVGAIPASAAHPDYAVKLLDYLMRPEVGARITNATGFISAVQDAALYIKPEIKNDPALNPAIDQLPRIVPEMAPSAEGASLRKKFWQLIGTPQQQRPAVK